MAFNHMSGALFTMPRLNYSIDLRVYYLQQSMWVDNMVGQKTQIRLGLFIFAMFAYLTASVPAMSYEEPKFATIKKTDIYEVRRY